MVLSEVGKNLTLIRKYLGGLSPTELDFFKKVLILHFLISFIDLLIFFQKNENKSIIGSRCSYPH